MSASRAERAAIAHVAQRLSAQFSMLDPDLVQRIVRDTHRRFDGHPTREFVPILVEDSARDRLRVTPGQEQQSGRPPWGRAPSRHRQPGVGYRNDDKVGLSDCSCLPRQPGVGCRKTWRTEHQVVDFQFSTCCQNQSSPQRQPVPRVPTGQFAAGCTHPYEATRFHDGAQPREVAIAAELPADASDGRRMTQASRPWPRHRRKPEHLRRF